MHRSPRPRSLNSLYSEARGSRTIRGYNQCHQNPLSPQLSTPKLRHNLGPLPPATDTHTHTHRHSLTLTLTLTHTHRHRRREAAGRTKFNGGQHGNVRPLQMNESVKVSRTKPPQSLVSLSLSLYSILTAPRLYPAILLLDDCRCVLRERERERERERPRALHLHRACATTEVCVLGGGGGGGGGGWEGNTDE